MTGLALAKNAIPLVLGTFIGLASFRTLDNWQTDRMLNQMRAEHPSVTETQRVDWRWTVETVLHKGSTDLFVLPDRTFSEQMTDRGVEVALGIRVEGLGHRERAKKLAAILRDSPELWRDAL